MSLIQLDRGGTSINFLNKLTSYWPLTLKTSIFLTPYFWDSSVFDTDLS